MRKPSILTKMNLAYLLPIFELGLDVESEQCRQMADELQKFYFGFSPVSAETILVYLMVRHIYESRRILWKITKSQFWEILDLK